MTAILPLTEVPARITRMRGPLLTAAPKADARSDKGPEGLLTVLDEFVGMLIKLDKQYGENETLQSDASQLVDTGLGVLAELSMMSARLGVKGAKTELERISIPVADWAMRHGGHISVPEPIINGLALFANEIQDRELLAQLVHFMTRLTENMSDGLQANDDKSNPGRPWRVLNLNRAIVATRSHDLDLMTQVFDDLVQRLPEEAAAFFREGMRQMEIQNYPLRVRVVVQRYFEAFAQRAIQ